MPNIHQKRGRRRSASESDGDPLLILMLILRMLRDAYLTRILTQQGSLMIHIEIVLVKDFQQEL